MENEASLLLGLGSRKLSHPQIPFPNKTTLAEAVAAWIDGSYNTSPYHQYGNIEDWNTTMITDMSELFHNATQFNEDISKWDVGNVANFTHMFHRRYKLPKNVQKRVGIQC
jgi:surface protein